MRRNAIFAHGIEKNRSWCARWAVLRTDFIDGRSKFPDSSQLHCQSKRGARTFTLYRQSVRKPRVNPYRLKLQAHPYGNWAFPRTDSRVQQDTLDETLSSPTTRRCLFSFHRSRGSAWDDSRVHAWHYGPYRHILPLDNLDWLHTQEWISRHEDVIISSVNHSGDSDSTGAICGN